MKKLDYFLQDWRIRKAVPHIPRGSRVLDIGCFDSRLFDALGERLGYGLGIDPLATPVQTPRYELRALPFTPALASEGPFDVITLLAVVEHIPEAELPEFARNCFALLSPGGVVVITVPDKRVDDILHLLVALRLIDGMSVHEHHAFDIGSVPETFGRAGFTAPLHVRFELGLNNLFVLKKPA